MVELPAPSVTTLPVVTPEPAGTAPADGVAVAENVMVWPLTVRDLPVSPVAATVAARPLESAPAVFASTVVAEIASGVVLLFVSALKATEPLMPPIGLVPPSAVVRPAAPL